MSFAGASISMAEISSLLEEHSIALAADFKSSFDSFNSTLDTLHTMVTVHGQQISSLEDNATDHRIQQLETAYSAMQLDTESLRTKMADLEGRSRRQNVRIIGLPENIEGTRPSTYFSYINNINSFWCEGALLSP